jgi:putative ABC transport system permease protein
MLWHYFKSYFRNIKKNKLFFAANLLSLTIGLAIGLVAFLWVYNQLSYDRFHKKADRIYRVLANKQYPPEIVSSHPPKLAERIKETFPEVEDALQLAPLASIKIRKDENNIFIGRPLNTNSRIFSFFDIELLCGNKANCLNNANSAVISQSLAKNIFGDENPVGRMLKVENLSISKIHLVPDMFITGVMEDMPSNSFLSTYNIITNCPVIEERMVETIEHNNINYTGKLLPYYAFECFVLLRKNVSKADFDYKMSPFVNKITYGSDYSPASYYLQPLTAMHLYSEEVRNNSPWAGNIRFVFIFGGVGLLFMLGAMFNFLGYTLVNFDRRLKEIGIYKFVGADTYSLLKKYLFESVLTFTAASLISISLIKAFSRNNIFSPLYSLFMFPKMGVLVTLSYYLVILLMAVFLTLYVVYLLTRVKTPNLIQGRITGLDTNRIMWRILISLQIAIPVLLMSCAIVIRNQITFLSEYDLGYSKENVYSISAYRPNDNFNTGANEAQKLTAFLKAELEKNKSVKNTSITSWIPTSDMVGGGWQVKNNGIMVMLDLSWVDKNYFNALKIGFVKKSAFEELEADSIYFVVPQNCADYFNIPYKNNSLPIIWNNITIVGITNPLYYGPLKGKIKNVFFQLVNDRNSSSSGHNIIFNIDKGKEKEVSDYISAKYKEYTGDKMPPLIALSENKTGPRYYTEEIMFNVVTLVTAITLFMALISIFSTVSHNIERRAKEIGIRKVYGASAKDVLTVVVKETVAIICVVTLITAPFVYLLMQYWLQEFTIRVNITIWVFITTALVTLAISLATVSQKAYGIMRANPVDSLKNE